MRITISDIERKDQVYLYEMIISGCWYEIIVNEDVIRQYSGDVVLKKERKLVDLWIRAGILYRLKLYNETEDIYEKCVEVRNRFGDSVSDVVGKKAKGAQ